MPGVLKSLLQSHIIDGNCMTVTGKTLGENIEAMPGLQQGQTVIMPIDNPIKANGNIQILFGSLAPEGSVAKISGQTFLMSFFFFFCCVLSCSSFVTVGFNTLYLLQSTHLELQLTASVYWLQEKKG